LLGARRRRQHLADRLDHPRHLVGDQVRVAVQSGEDGQAGAVADRLDDHQPALHLDQRLSRQACLEDPRRALHQADQPGGDGRELLGEKLGDALRQRKRYTVRGYHDGVRDIHHSRGEVGDQPVQVLAVCVIQRSAPSAVRGVWPSARRVPRWNPLRRLRAISGDRGGRDAVGVDAA
jgi:hypothetical protein